MSQGRPPNWNPFSSLGADVWTEVAEFGSKGRIGIALAARRRLPWFDEAVENGLLATLEPDGYAQLAPWSSAGGELVAEIKEKNLDRVSSPRRNRPSRDGPIHVH